MVRGSKKSKACTSANASGAQKPRLKTAECQYPRRPGLGSVPPTGPRAIKKDFGVVERFFVPSKGRQSN